MTTVLKKLIKNYNTEFVSTVPQPSPKDAGRWLCSQLPQMRKNNQCAIVWDFSKKDFTTMNAEQLASSVNAWGEAGWNSTLCVKQWTHDWKEQGKTWRAVLTTEVWCLYKEDMSVRDEWGDPNLVPQMPVSSLAVLFGSLSPGFFIVKVWFERL
jgi:hypothetical protein